ncbi:MAG: hypothetical protein AB3N14_09155 [Flavobacteriaceae bacterium]
MKSVTLLFSIFLLFSVASCNLKGDQKNKAFAVQTQTGGFELEGKITFEEFRAYRDIPVSIVEVNLPDLSKKRLTAGRFAWRHPEGEIIITEGCGSRVNRLVLMEENGRKTLVSPCSSEIPNPGYSPTAFEFSRISPDKKYVAAEVKYYYQDAYRYSTLVLKNKAIIKVFDNYAAPEWLPDGRLLMVSDGLYVSKIDGEPQKIDDGSLISGPNNPDLDPSGKHIAFEWNQRIWTMDLDGKNLKELASGSAIYRYPEWSPNGKYIAFLSTNSYAYSDYARGIHIIEVDTGENIFLDLAHVLGGKSGFHIPQGPLSWTK